MAIHGRIVAGIDAVLSGTLLVGSAHAAEFIVKDGQPCAQIFIAEQPPTHEIGSPRAATV